MTSVSRPLILSIESSAETCGVALSAGTTVLAEMSCFTRHVHDRLLARYCRDILRDTGHSPSGLHAVAVSAGPGSFTGLRIGASLAKALCFDDTPPLIAVPTLAALASAADEFARAVGAGSVTASVASHKDLVYAQTFTVDAVPLSEIRLMPLADLQREIGPDTVVCGPVVPALHPPFRGLSGLNRLTPRFIARLAVRMYAAGQFTPAADFVPLYGQDFVPRTFPAAE